MTIQKPAFGKTMIYMGFWLERVRRAGMPALFFLLLMALGAPQVVQAKDYGALERERIDLVFPEATAVSEPEGDYGVRTIRKGEELTYNYYTEGCAEIPCRCTPGCQGML